MFQRLTVNLALLLALGCATVAPATPADRLETTPRHDEWVQIESGGRTLHAYVVYPQVSRQADAVLLIHENRGLTDWVRTVADRLAAEGFIAIAPDFLSGSGPAGGRTSDFPSQDAAREAISRLTREQVMEDLARATSYVRSLPSASGTVAVAGFCWGGARTWDFANVGDRIAASFVFYGTGPSTEDAVSGIDGPVYGFYGGDDARVNSTIDASAAVMQKQGKRFEPVIYPGAGHAFMRLAEEPDGSEANKSAHEAAWKRWLALLRNLPD